MKTQLLFIIFISGLLSASGQVKISGKVTDKQGDPLPGVNLYIEGSYDGASSDHEGLFQFVSTEKRKKNLVASFIGYTSRSQEVDLSSDVQVSIVLQEAVNTIDAVTITAGRFAAGDEKRANILEPLDIYTTASANGDVMAAMRTMPGTQAGTDDGRLMVRGGDAYETKTYIDGLLAAKPYFSKTPDVATRGRFAPSLFEGVMFNTGGYSAEYGQALSSVLVLNSTDVASEDVAGLSLMTIGLEGNMIKAMKNSSVMLSGGYTNLAPYHKLTTSYIDWTKPVEALNLTSAFRIKPSSDALLKAFATCDLGRMAYNVPNDAGEYIPIKNEGGTGYANVSFRDCLSEKSCYRLGLSSTYDNNQISVNGTEIKTDELSAEARATMVHELSKRIVLTYGISETFLRYSQNINFGSEDSLIELGFDDHILGAFIESEIKFSKNFALRPGIRSEYSSILDRFNLSPRLAFAVKTSKNSQFSGAWGLYFQNPEADYIKFKQHLDFEQASHYIASWQAGSVSHRLFRMEAYYKTYRNLITWEGNNQYTPQHISNSGFGQATGLDLFWRDRKSLKNFEYWLTYSFVDTQRKYENYPEAVSPDFVSDHNFSVVGKYWIHAITTQIGASYTFASPRPYDNPNTAEFMDGRTDWYGDLSLNMSHIFYLGHRYSVLYASVTNVLGRDHVFGYRPSGIRDAQGNYTLIPVKQDSKRFFFVGLFLSF